VVFYITSVYCQSILSGDVLGLHVAGSSTISSGPKFLCIKLISLLHIGKDFSYLSSVWLGAIPDNVTGYTQTTLRAAIQDALICIEMPIFAVAHWYAFSGMTTPMSRFCSSNACIVRTARFIWECEISLKIPRRLSVATNTSIDSLIQATMSSLMKDHLHELARMMEGMRYERGGKGNTGFLNLVRRTRELLF